MPGAGLVPLVANKQQSTGTSQGKFCLFMQEASVCLSVLCIRQQPSHGLALESAHTH